MLNFAPFSPGSTPGKPWAVLSCPFGAPKGGHPGILSLRPFRAQGRSLPPPGVSSPLIAKPLEALLWKQHERRSDNERWHQGSEKEVQRRDPTFSKSRREDGLTGWVWRVGDDR